MLIKNIGLLLLSFCFFCSFKEPKYCKLSDKIFIPYNKELCKRKQVVLCGSGGAMMGDIQKINASYISFNRMNVEEARRLYVDIIEGYLCRYNQDEVIRPYLHDYPFTIANLDVMIGFENEQRKHMGQGFVALVFCGKNNCLIYEAYDHVQQKFINLYKEPYETAREIVLNEQR